MSGTLVVHRVSLCHMRLAGSWSALFHAYFCSISKQLARDTLPHVLGRHLSTRNTARPCICLSIRALGINTGGTATVTLSQPVLVRHEPVYLHVRL